ncbi:MAG: ArsR/SmtB family transcription factor [Sporichthyaceae bacterium]
MTEKQPTHVELDSASIRTLAHPLRSRLLGQLRLQGPATATQLATRLGTNSGTTSYHLRKLADVGLVVEEAGSGDGRDRWWRAAHDMTSWSDAEFQDNPDDRAAADWLIGYQLRTCTERTQSWLDNRSEWPAEWLESDMSDYRLYLTVDQMKELSREVHEVVARYRELGEVAKAAGLVGDPTAPPADPAVPMPVAFMVQLHPDTRA